MRMVVGVLSLLFVVAFIGVLAKKHFAAVAPVSVPATSGPSADMPAPTGTPKQQVKQFQQGVEATLQQARPMPEEK